MLRFLAARRWLLAAMATFALVALLGGALAFAALFAHASTKQTLASTLYGASTSQTQTAVNAAQWPQQKTDWCGVATVAAVAQFVGKTVTQQNVADYLNSSAGVSEWGTPSFVGYGPDVKADIARDFGTDPRSIAAGLANATQVNYHQLVDLLNASNATAHLAADLVRAQQPISVIVDHGAHSVLVSGVYATADPVANPGSITAVVVWDPGVGVPNAGIQPTQMAVVPIATWLCNSLYWGESYQPNYFGPYAADPDPAVGPYTNDPSHNKFTHLWIGHYVYLRPDATTDPSAGINVDWPFNQDGALIEGFDGSIPTGYTGPTFSLLNKLTLSDESTEAPALWTEAAGALQPPAKGSFAPVSVLSWVGTDGQHHLNVNYSNDGMTYSSQTKVILGETSITRPAVTVIRSSNNLNIVAIAWVGTDQAHSLNVLYDVYHQQFSTSLKLTLHETSPYAPALTTYNGQIWLAWAGTDANHSMNMESLGPEGMTPGKKTTLWSYPTHAAPVIFGDTVDNVVLATWQNGSTRQLMLAQSADEGTTWNVQPPSPQTSGVTPDVMVINATGVTQRIPPYYWSWIATDGIDSINIMQGTSLTAWAKPFILTDTSPFEPVIGYVGQTNRILLAWTGTDPQHHMNIATVPE